MWDPTTYLRYGDERARPFVDLLARVAAERPRAVVDLGCGPGNLTATLATRWPGARVRGIDSSVEMVRQAAALNTAVDFSVGDLRDWRPGPDDDVVVSNAALQWVPGHESLLVDWATRLPAGAWLAVQVPGNFDALSHRALRALIDAPDWRDRLGHLARRDPVLDPVGYAELLTGAGCSVDAWETSYVHRLPADPATGHPVLGWMEGTALRPVRAALADEPAAWAAFRRELDARLSEAYPVHGGRVHFPFRRIFFVARTAR
ncbi:MAG TPA: trans-aconitate 2-methyltransferase [Micromonospora sp.]